MSERKRLSDDEVGVLHAGIQAAHGARWKVLAADHIQARDDVKRLAQRLREATGGHDSGCSWLRMNFGPPECNCATGALLSEVTTP